MYPQHFFLIFWDIFRLVRRKNDHLSKIYSPSKMAAKIQSSTTRYILNTFRYVFATFLEKLKKLDKHASKKQTCWDTL